jgi:ubiquinone/menaquinone biosynthesis C-methylase UbiE
MNELPTLWDFHDEKTMLSHLIGNSFGQNPEERLDQIRDEKRRMAEFICSQLGLTKKSVVAEIGSGTGFVAMNVAPMVRQLHCCDISESFLAIAQRECKKLKNLSFHKITSGSLSPIPDSCLDAVYSANTFIHFNLYDIFHYFCEFQRVLKPGGKVWFDMVSSDGLAAGLPPLFLEMSGLYAKVPDGLALLVQYQSPRAVTGIAAHFGFKALSIAGPPTAPWILFEKASAN